MTRSERRAYRAYTTGAKAVCALPEPVAYALAKGAGWWMYYAMPGRRRMAERHQARVTGASGRAMRRNAHRVFQSYARYWCEFFRIAKDAAGDPEALNARFRVDGFERIVAGVDAGKGVILALPHVGGWEFAGAWLANQGYPPTVVAERVKPPELFDFFVQQRTALGMHVIALDKHAGDNVLAALRANQVVCLVSDRDLKHDGVPVEFFGEATTMPAGPAAMALRTGATLLPVAVYFDGRYGHHAVIEAPLDTSRTGSLRDDVQRVTQDLAHRFEDLICRAPDEWHVLQPNWPSDQEPDVTSVPSADRGGVGG